MRQITNLRYGHRFDSGVRLIIVLWITFGLVSIALYFSHSMFFEFRASDNNAAGIEAQQAIDGEAVLNYLTTNLVGTGMMDVGMLPTANSISGSRARGERDALADRRTNVQFHIDTPRFGLVDGRPS